MPATPVLNNFMQNLSGHNNFQSYIAESQSPHLRPLFRIASKGLTYGTNAEGRGKDSGGEKTVERCRGSQLLAKRRLTLNA